jgi:hypothetical protein
MTIRGQIRNAFPAYRVYIYGKNVTEDVLEVSPRFQIGRSPNTCSITLANNLDKYIFTTDDLIIAFSEETLKEAARKKQARIEQSKSEVDPDYVESMYDSEDIDSAIQDNVTRIENEIKREVISQKITERIKGIQQPDISDQLGSLKPLSGDAFRYPFQAEDPIFHANDPVRVWFRDPFNSNRWYHMFSGFISDFDDHVDENNQRILTIVAEGPSKILRYARITTNPGIVDIKAIEDAEKDAAFRSFYEAGFNKVTLLEFLFATIFGNDPDGTYGGKFKIKIKTADGKQELTNGRFRGVGRFNFKRSMVVEFGPESQSNYKDPYVMSETDIPTSTVTSLAEYQSIIDHEVKDTDLGNMAHEDADIDKIMADTEGMPKRADGTIDPLTVIDYIGTHPEIYPIDGGALIIMVPKSFSAQTNREILLRDIISSVSMTTEFKSRLSMIYDAMDRIEFSFYESPKGDLICEMPFYDFDPDDFGVEALSTSKVAIGGQLIDEETSRGPFAGRWIINKGDTFNFSKGITDEKVRTQLACTWYAIKSWDRTGGTFDGISKPSVVTLRHLVPLYWLRLETANPKGYIASPEAALAYAHLTLNKLNADARSLGINAVPNLGIWLNRPLYFGPRNCVGRVTGVTHNIKWGSGGSMDTRVNINHIRGWDGLLDNDGNPVYTPIGGAPSQPLNYKLLFGLYQKVDGGSASPPAEAGQEQEADSTKRDKAKSRKPRDV